MSQRGRVDAAPARSSPPTVRTSAPAKKPDRPRAIDPGARTITVESTNDDGIGYEVDASATIMSGAQKLALGDLKTGWSVAMNGHRVGDTRRITMIKVVKAP
jgi:hypothetical protein